MFTLAVVLGWMVVVTSAIVGIPLTALKYAHFTNYQKKAEMYINRHTWLSEEVIYFIPVLCMLVFFVGAIGLSTITS
jgi:hypothetical protein